jgi:hypothetical protein
VHLLRIPCVTNAISAASDITSTFEDVQQPQPVPCAHSSASQGDSREQGAVNSMRC